MSAPSHYEALTDPDAQALDDSQRAHAASTADGRGASTDGEATP